MSLAGSPICRSIVFAVLPQLLGIRLKSFSGLRFPAGGRLSKSLWANVLLSAGLVQWGLPAIGAKQREGPVRQAVVWQAEGPGAQKVVWVDGLLDSTNTDPPYEPARSITIDNCSSEPIATPRIEVDGRGPAHNPAEILSRAGLKPDDTPRERAVKIHDFVMSGWRHDTFSCPELRRPLDVWNYYGIGLCYENAACMAKLLHWAGTPTVGGRPFGHSTVQAIWDGKPHLLDGDICFRVYKRDGSDFISESDMAEDPEYALRCIPYGRNQGFLDYNILLYRSLWLPREDSPAAPVSESPAESLSHLLRPAESLTYAPAAAEAPLRRGPEETHIRGIVRWAPPLDSRFPAMPGVEGTNVAAPGAGAPVDSLGLVPFPGAQAALKITSFLPGPFLDVAVTAEFALTPGDPIESLPQAAVRLKDKLYVLPWRMEEGGQARASSAGVFEASSPSAPLVCQPQLLILWQPSGAPAPLKALSTEYGFQMTRQSYPAFHRGRNRVVYRADSPGRAEIRIELEESRAKTPPPAPRLIWPKPGSVVHSLRPTFRWKAPPNSGSRPIARFHIRATRDPKLALAETPAREAKIALDPPVVAPALSWTPHYDGLFFPGETYSWQVRHQDDQGVWSEWSPWYTFDAVGPAPPEEIRWEESPGGKIYIKWRPSQQGTPPVRYELYASDEYGFAALREPLILKGPPSLAHTWIIHNYDKGMPATLVGETRETQFLAASPLPGDSVPCKVFWRIAAIDEYGARSAPSAMVALPSPRVLVPQTVPMAAVLAAPPSQCRLGVLRSLGRHYARATNGWDYEVDWWDRQEINLRLEGAPRWLRIDNNGELSGEPPRRAVGQRFPARLLASEPKTGYAEAFDFEIEVVKRRETYKRRHI